MRRLSSPRNHSPISRQARSRPPSLKAARQESSCPRARDRAADHAIYRRFGLNDRNQDHQPSGAEARLLLPVPACLITRLLTLDWQTPSASAARRKLTTMSNCHAAANSYDTRSSPRNQLAADCSSLRAQRSNTMHCKILTSFDLGYPSRARTDQNIRHRGSGRT